MKTKAMGMFALLIIALSVAGFAYAHWSEIIKINGIVSTGSLTVGFSDILNCWDKEDYRREVLGLDYKDVGTEECWLEQPYTDVHTNKTIYKKMWVRLNSTYGCYWAICKFNVTNAGTVPAVINNVTITYDPMKYNVTVITPYAEWVLNNVTTGEPILNIWIYKEPIPMPVPWIPPQNFTAPPEPLIDNQIDPCHELTCEIWVHVKQTAPECHTYEFDIEIEFMNWNG